MAPKATVERVTSEPAMLTVPAGSTWLPPVALATTQLDAHQPQVAVDPQGGAVVAWLRPDPALGGADQVQAVFRPAGGSFGAVQRIADAGSDITGSKVADLRVARDGQGNTLVVWNRSFAANPHTRVQAAFIPAGAQSAVASVISQDGQDATSPQVAFGPRGEALVMWRSFDGTTTRIQVALRPAGHIFSPPQAIPDPGRDAAEPQIVFDRSGGALAVWTSVVGSSRLVQAAFRPAGRGFGPVQTISDPGQDATGPQIALDVQGNALAVWHRFDGTTRRVQAAFRSAGGSFGAAQTISPVGQDCSQPQVRYDLSGNVTVLWRLATGDTSQLQSTFRQTWGSFAPVQTLSALGSNVFWTQLAVDGRGAALAVALWQEIDDFGTHHIKAATRPAAQPFRAAEVIKSVDVSQPQLAIDGRGDAIAVWMGSTGADTSVRAALRAPAQTVSGLQLITARRGDALALWTSSAGASSFRMGSVRPAAGSFGPGEGESHRDGVFELRYAIGERGGDAVASRRRQIGTNIIIDAATASLFGPPDDEPQTLDPACQDDVVHHKVAIDARGNAAAIWRHSTGTDVRLRGAFQPVGGSFEPAQEISAAGRIAHESRLAFDGRGDAIVIWQDDSLPVIVPLAPGDRPETTDDGIRIQVAVRPAGGRVFGRAQRLSVGASALELLLAVDALGNAVAAWGLARSGGVQTAVRPAGGSFGPAQTVVGVGGRDLRLAVGQGGNALVVGRSSNGPNNTTLQAAFRPAGGSFGPAQTLSAAGHVADDAQLAVDAQGNAIVMWTLDPAGNNICVQAAFRPAGGSFGPAQTVSQLAAEPRVAFDPQGNAIAVWEHSIDGITARMEAAIRPAGGSFGPAEVISENSKGDFSPQLAIDTQGNALAIWRGSDGTNLRFQAAFRPAGGRFGPP